MRWRKALRNEKQNFKCDTSSKKARNVLEDLHGYKIGVRQQTWSARGKRRNRRGSGQVDTHAQTKLLTSP